MDRDNTIARLENIAKHAVHTAGEDTFILSLDDGLAIHEAIEALKAQLSQQGTTKGTTSDLISKTETVEHLRRMLETTVPNTDYDEGFIDGIEFGISTVSTMPTVQPEPSIPLSWVEKHIEWLKSLDNEFANLAAAHISVMVKKWRDEQNETD